MERNNTYGASLLGIVLAVLTWISLPVSAHYACDMFEYYDDNKNQHMMERGNMDQSMMEQGAMNNGQKMMGDRTRRHYSSMMDERGFMRHHEDCFDQGMMWGLDKLNLTDQKRERIEAMQNQFRRLQWTEMGHIRDQQFRLRTLLRDKQPDPMVIKEIYATLFDHRRKLMESKIQLQNEMLELLSEDQADQAKPIEGESD